jgi:hypothetical protein
MDVLYGSLGINELQFLIKKSKEKNFSCMFLSILFTTTLDPYPYQDPDSLDVSGFSESGSTTMAPAAVFRVCILWNWIHVFPEFKSP